MRAVITSRLATSKELGSGRSEARIWRNLGEKEELSSGRCFQTKSCLDVLSWVLKPAFGFTYCSFGDKGDDTIKQLKNNCPTKLAIYAEKIIKLIEDAQGAWLVELIKMRDEVTHYSRLEGFDCFMEDPYIGGALPTFTIPLCPISKGYWTIAKMSGSSF